MATVPPTVASLFSLTGKTAIVTGGTGGLGLAMTLALAEAGANIVSIQLPSDPLASSLHSAVTQQHGRQFSSYDCDVADSANLRAAYARIREAGVEPDILLNCAGIQRRGAAEEMDDATIDEVFAVNLKATFVSCQEFARRCFELRRPGKIINVASIVSFISGTNISPYIATKGGVLQTTKAFSSEWAGRGVNVNCICPGYFRTALTEQYSTDVKYKDFNDYILSRTPAGRWGVPEDLRGAIIFLAGKASDFVTGQSIVVDGGLISK
ncbi:MAG: hypothetical protein M1828_001650 [Chrysothrix sp. TS-e1954]|nr:MAG: hypothetical protein M1828_001650 [Chrysothrix sp. TS-e1954]